MKLPRYCSGRLYRTSMVHLLTFPQLTALVSRR